MYSKQSKLGLLGPTQQFCCVCPNSLFYGKVKLNYKFIFCGYILGQTNLCSYIFIQALYILNMLVLLMLSGYTFRGWRGQSLLEVAPPVERLSTAQNTVSTPHWSTSANPHVHQKSPGVTISIVSFLRTRTTIQ